METLVLSAIGLLFGLTWSYNHVQNVAIRKMQEANKNLKEKLSKSEDDIYKKCGKQKRQTNEFLGMLTEFLGIKWEHSARLFDDGWDSKPVESFKFSKIKKAKKKK